MDKNKKVVILVVIALILAVVAITLNSLDSKVSTTKDLEEDLGGSGNVGVNIVSGEIEDKLSEETTGEQP